MIENELLREDEKVESWKRLYPCVSRKCAHQMRDSSEILRHSINRLKWQSAVDALHSCHEPHLVSDSLNKLFPLG